MKRVEILLKLRHFTDEVERLRRYIDEMERGRGPQKRKKRRARENEIRSRNPQSETLMTTA